MEFLSSLAKLTLFFLGKFSDIVNLLRSESLEFIVLIFFPHKSPARSAAGLSHQKCWLDFRVFNRLDRL